MIRTSSQEGFSAVELLITLFVAVAFIATGYQLYSTIVKDGGEARFRARASNLAYENLRRASDTTSTCSTSPVESYPSVPSGSGLDTPVIKQTISAPQGCGGSTWLMKVEITVTYGPQSDRQDVTHAVYVSK
jgi:type II secretory pathway pseudopilin PulG